jgi:hypothetical protein
MKRIAAHAHAAVIPVSCCAGIVALRHMHRQKNQAATIDAYPAVMNATNSNLTLGARLGLTVLALLLWALGGTLDGSSPRALIIVPLLVGVWMLVVFIADRWVRASRDELSAPRSGATGINQVPLGCGGR